MQFHVIRHGSVDSTSERAFAALADGSARHGDVHVADAQTAGRGRQGRRWHSPSAGGLYASVVLLPGVELSAAGLTIAAGLAVHDAVVRLGVGAAALDWPNDVIVRDARNAAGAKLAGILVETRGLDPLRPHYVAGIGLNVAQQSFPLELTSERAVTSLRLCGCAVTIDAALDALLDALPRRLDAIRLDPQGLARDYLSATGLAGARVRVRAGDGTCEGRIEAFDVHAGLVLVAEDGRARTLALEVVREIATL
jgi:BirA family transcriptional regulator, biotin operon repressor / biotin---[acetyl-CoA-carboxylase] ligase